jgi:hypothetical protein
MKPQSIDEALFKIYSTAGDVLRVKPEDEYVAHLIGGALTTAGIQYGTLTTQSTGITSLAGLKNCLASTISWPGLEGCYIDELEAGLTIEFAATAVAATTMGYIWEIKNKGETTWTAITAVETTKASTVATYTARTVSGYRLYRDGTLDAGYNKLPLNIRCRFFAKNAAAKGKMRVKSSSYVAIKPKKA